MANTLVVLLAFVAVQFTLSESFNFRWCYIGDPQKAKCSDFIKEVNKTASNLTINVTVDCVAGENAENCIGKIQSDTADLVTLDGGHVFSAGDKSGLIPVMAEEYGRYGPKYYAVAVVKKSNENLKLDKTLRGKKSCHTGARRTAGWNVPIGYLIGENVIPKEGCDTKYFDFISVGNFFSKSCVPGSSGEKYNSTGDVPGNLCSLCAGSGNDQCSSDAAKNKYAGYHGAFKCMAEEAGDVAFVKHTTANEVVGAGGYGNLTDYKYLCKNGETKDIGHHENCNLGFNPAHAVVTRANYNVEDIVSILKAMSERFGVNQTNPNVFQLFNSTKYNGSNLLFKDSTTALSEIPDKTYKGYLTEDYVKDAKALQSCDEPTERSTTTRPTEPATSKSNMAAPSATFSGVMALVALRRF